jgi:hypothetical protein
VLPDLSNAKILQRVPWRKRRHRAGALNQIFWLVFFDQSGKPASRSALLTCSILAGKREGITEFS